MSKSLTLLVAAKLHANQLERHLELFEHIDEVGRVIVVRHEAIPERLPKVENRSFNPGTRPGEALRMMHRVRSVIREENVDWVLGFNPVPWGSLALAAARSCGTPACLSLIGMDYLQIQKAWGRPFLEAVRLAEAITVTGNKMVEGLTGLGVERQKIRILPHSVDTARFAPKDGDNQYDIISVGQLIERKRMDVLIDAVGLLANEGQRLRVGILGRGPLEEELRQQARKLGVEDLVEFLGYRDDVEAIVSSARVFCLVSQWEGVPFAMMEAMSAGLVPVVTDVGTIADWVSPHQNGEIVPVGDPNALAKTLRELFGENESKLSRLRQQVIAERDRLSFESGAAVWRDVLGL